MDNITLIGIFCGLSGGLAIAIGVVAVKRWWHRRRMLRKGRRGEQAVARALSSLDSRENILLNDILLPSPSAYKDTARPGTERTSQIDHILISTRGIFVIETKSLAGRIEGSEQAQYWRQHLSDSIRRFYNPLLQNVSHIRTLRRLLRDIDTDTFVSVTVFTEAWRLDLHADDIIIPRRLLPDRHIRRTLIPSERRNRHWWTAWLPTWFPEWLTGREIRLDERKIVVTLPDLATEIKRRPHILDREEMDDIAERIMAANRNSRSDRRHHIHYAKKVQKETLGSIRRGICPRCGGRLIIRHGRSGDFAACECYPDCRFTCAIDLLH